MKLKLIASFMLIVTYDGLTTYLYGVGKPYYADELSKKILDSNTDIQAYDTKFVDAEFTLVDDVLQLLK